MRHPASWRGLCQACDTNECRTFRPGTLVKQQKTAAELMTYTQGGHSRACVQCARSETSSENVAHAGHATCSTLRVCASTLCSPCVTQAIGAQCNCATTASLLTRYLAKMSHAFMGSRLWPRVSSPSRQDIRCHRICSLVCGPDIHGRSLSATHGPMYHNASHLVVSCLGGVVEEHSAPLWLLVLPRQENYAACLQVSARVWSRAHANSCIRHGEVRPRTSA